MQRDKEEGKGGVVGGGREGGGGDLDNHSIIPTSLVLSRTWYMRVVDTKEDLKYG